LERKLLIPRETHGSAEEAEEIDPRQSCLGEGGAISPSTVRNLQLS